MNESRIPGYVPLTAHTLKDSGVDGGRDSQQKRGRGGRDRDRRRYRDDNGYRDDHENSGNRDRGPLASLNGDGQASSKPHRGRRFSRPRDSNDRNDRRDPFPRERNSQDRHSQDRRSPERHPQDQNSRTEQDSNSDEE